VEENMNEEMNVRLEDYRNEQEYEINKYMNNNISPVHLPNMPNSIRSAHNE
jgi:hypothetical protein